MDAFESGGENKSMKINRIRTFFFLSILFPLICAAFTRPPLRIAVLGSSTAAGAGAPKGQGWVALYDAYLKSRGFPDSTIINFAIGGFTTFNILPTHYDSPYRRLNERWDISPAPNNNITKALTFNPTHIIINLPSNDAAQLRFPVACQLDHYRVVIAQATAWGAEVWVTTTQPRNSEPGICKLLTDMRDSTFLRYGDHAIDFWTLLAAQGCNINPVYDYGDHVHLNASGHRILYERVREQIPVPPILTVSPESIFFGDVALGASAQRTATITNHTIAALSLKSISTHTPDFSVRPEHATVAPGDTLTVTVTYAPGSLEASHDAVAFISLDGSILSRLQVSGNSPIPTASLEPHYLDFGDVASGQSRRLPLRILNHSINAITVAAIRSGMSVYSIENISATILPFHDLQVMVRFAPLCTGSYADTLYIEGNAANFPVACPLNGRSPAPLLSVMPQSLDFGEVVLESSRTLHLNLHNPSINMLTINRLANRDPAFRTDASFMHVKAADSTILPVTFVPTVVGEVLDTLDLYNDSANSPLRIPLRGYSPPPVLEVETAALAFPEYVYGETNRLPVMLWNRSANRLRISALQNALPHFRTLSAFPLAVPGNDGVTLQVEFLPLTGGVWQDTLEIVGDGGSARIPMYGTAPLQKLYAQPNYIDFGRVRIGSARALWCTLVRYYPAEEGGVTIDSTAFNSGMFSIVAVSGATTLISGDTLGLAIALHPFEVGDISDTLSIYMNGFSSLLQIPLSGAGVILTSVASATAAIPGEFGLCQNYPNPFNARTTITFAIPVKSTVTLRIFDLVGREVAMLLHDTIAAGVHQAIWDAGNASGGLFFCRLEARAESSVPEGKPAVRSAMRKLLLVK